jgi:hypothetical protein
VQTQSGGARLLHIKAEKAQTQLKKYGCCDGKNEHHKLHQLLLNLKLT